MRGPQRVSGLSCLPFVPSHLRVCRSGSESASEQRVGHWRYPSSRKERCQARLEVLTRTVGQQDGTGDHVQGRMDGRARVVGLGICFLPRLKGLTVIQNYTRDCLWREGDDMSLKLSAGDHDMRAKAYPSVFQVLDMYRRVLCCRVRHHGNARQSPIVRHDCRLGRDRARMDQGRISDQSGRLGMASRT